MSIDAPPEGYGLSDYPANMPAEQIALLLEKLKAGGYQQTGGYLGVDDDPVSVSTMVPSIERSRRTDGLAGVVIGPLVLGDQLYTGNSIGLWEKSA